MRLEHILVPVDFAASTEVALDRAVALAADYRADVTLFHAIPLPFFGRDAEAADAERERACELLRAIVQGKLRELRRLHGWSGVVLTEVVFGSPADEIAAAAERLDCDAIVMTPRRRSAFSHAVAPSTTDKVIRRSSCPVIVVRAPSWAWVEPEAETVETEMRWGLVG